MCCLQHSSHRDSTPPLCVSGLPQKPHPSPSPPYRHTCTHALLTPPLFPPKSLNPHKQKHKNTKQVSGEAQYTDDVALPPNTLHAAFVTSIKPHAKLLGVDASAALAMPGVVGFFGADDVPGDNMIGPIMHDEEVFATKEVTCVGQVSE